MAADMAVDFQDTGIAAVSIWMGSLLTETRRPPAPTIPLRNAVIQMVSEAHTPRGPSAAHLV
jgi:hypothetical protein